MCILTFDAEAGDRRLPAIFTVYSERCGAMHDGIVCYGYRINFIGRQSLFSLLLLRLILDLALIKCFKTANIDILLCTDKCVVIP